MFQPLQKHTASFAKKYANENIEVSKYSDINKFTPKRKIKIVLGSAGSSFVKLTYKKESTNNCCERYKIFIECSVCGMYIMRSYDYLEDIFRKGRIDTLMIHLKNKVIENHAVFHGSPVIYSDRPREHLDTSKYLMSFQRNSIFADVSTLSCGFCLENLAKHSLTKHTENHTVKRIAETHFKYDCTAIKDEMKRCAYFEEENRLAIIEIMDKYFKKMELENKTIYEANENHIVNYVYSRENCDCGSSNLITCKICGNKFKHEYQNKELLYKKIMRKHCGKRKLYVTYMDFIFPSEKSLSENLTRILRYSCVVCGVMYLDSNGPPDENIVLTHFAACVANNKEKMQSSGHLCNISY